ncbi:cystathionine beta-lyase [Pigmentiphaga aceris]|uniref:Cystathionine beta-lyase n=2 Tax=Pigmentiphaga aceris TaxID=1940612 RepID=A0A5C0B8E3_9BURK|nr:cystathionine beta-lyase [Pigmentiphaga aceris]
MLADASPVTRLIHTAPAPAGFASLTQPVHHASTVLFPSVHDHEIRDGFDETRYNYGLSHTPTTLPLSRAVADWEGGYNALLTPSGLSAVSLAMLSCLSAGDHVLIPSNAYVPAKILAKGLLSRLGITHTLYDPLIGADIESLMTPATRLVWVETPGSITMEVADLPAIAKVAHAHGAQVAVDNTWSSGSLLRVFEKGADLSVQALTKYHGGHGDLLMGAVVTADHAGWHRVRETSHEIGFGVSADDAFLVLRGMQTMALRLKHVGDVALSMANWLAARPEIQRVLHPALPSCPGHETWKRDFTGSSGLFSVVFDPQYDDAAIARFVDSLQLFGIGASWGGTASLALVYRAMRGKVAGQNGEPGGHIVRLNIGLEAEADLRADLLRGMSALHGA